MKVILQKQGYVVKTKVFSGSAKYEINKIAEGENYSLVVVGAPVQSLTSGLFLGAQTYELIYFTRKPILLIRLTDNSESGKYFKTGRCINVANPVLFPTDFSSNAENAFEYLLKMVDCGSKEIILFHVQDQALIKPYLENRLEEFNEIDFKRLQTLKEILQKRGAEKVETILRVGSPSVEIIKFVRERQIEFVVMGSQGRGFMKELFLGSVSHNVARLASACVLLIPAKLDRA